MAKKKKFDLMGVVMKTGALAGGAIAARSVSKLPVIKDQNLMIQAGAKIALGIALPYLVENEIVEFAGYGAIAAGGIELAGELVPSIAGFGGDMVTLTATPGGGGNVAGYGNEGVAI